MSHKPPAALPALPLSARLLLHHKLVGYSVARDFLVAVQACSIRSAHLRDQALRAAQSAALNTAEGAGRVSRADKARAFAIPRAECVEAAAAVEIAALSGGVGEARLEEVLRLACQPPPLAPARAADLAEGDAHPDHGTDAVYGE